MKKLSDYYARLNSALPELFAEVPQISSCLGKEPEEPLPDPEGDPAQLMRNIYTIQNRYLPKEDLPDRISVPEEEGERVFENPASEDEGPSQFDSIPQFDEEEGDVPRVSDIISEDVGTIDTDELIANTAAKCKEILGQSD